MRNKVLASISVASLGVLLAIIWAGSPGPPPMPPAPPPPAPSALARPIAELRLDSATLQNALDAIRDQAHLNLIVEWDELDKNGVKPSMPVRLRLWDITAETALAVVLRLAAKDKASFHELDGIVTVSTPERLNSVSILRIYDVTDVIQRLRARAPDHQVSWEEAVDGLTKMIEDNVDTDSWRDNGGSVGSLFEMSGLLIVRQTPGSHTKLQHLLDSVRAAALPPRAAPSLAPP